MSKIAPPTLDVTTDIKATPRVVIDAFFDPAALPKWLKTVRSVTIPRPLGPYTLEWPESTDNDDVLGHLGGTLRGIVMSVEPTRGFLVADVCWLPPVGNPIGPMAMEVTCRLGVAPDGLPATKVRVTQSGFEEGTRWRRYYEVSRTTWQDALDALKASLERHA